VGCCHGQGERELSESRREIAWWQTRKSIKLSFSKGSSDFRADKR
jgi:hypothetical protein